MEKIVLYSEMRAFVKPEENIEEIRNAIVSFIPLDFEKEKLSINETSAQGFDKKVIKILTLKLEKQRHVKPFITHIIEKLSEEQKKTLVDQIPSRLDDECNYFIRFSKDEFLKGELELTDSGECFHLKFSIAAFPAKKEIAKEVVRKWLTNE